MNSSQAQSTVLTSLVVSGLLVVSSDAIKGQVPPARLIVGYTVAGVALASMASWAPSMAGGLSLLVLVSAAFTFGPDSWRLIANTLNHGAAPSSAPSASSGAPKSV
jgi:hypothetical protein